MEEDNKEEINKKEDREREDSEPKERNKMGGIGVGLSFGLIFAVVCILLSSMIPFSAIWGLLLPILYVALIVLCFAKGENRIGVGLILVLCIPLLIFGGCLLLLS